MRYANKKIRKACEESAENEALKHVEKMEDRGWFLTEVDGGDTGLIFEISLHFSKPRNENEREYLTKLVGCING